MLLVLFDQDKGEQLRKKFDADSFPYEIVAAIEKEGAFNHVLEASEATVLLHTARPVTMEAKDFQKETLSPAIDVTKHVLQAIQLHCSQIKRLASIFRCCCK